MNIEYSANVCTFYLFYDNVFNSSYFNYQYLHLMREDGAR